MTNWGKSKCMHRRGGKENEEKDKANKSITELKKKTMTPLLLWSLHKPNIKKENHKKFSKEGRNLETRVRT